MATSEKSDDARIRQFILELAALTRKHGIAIGGCGCCDSPYLIEHAPVSHPDAGYALSYPGDCGLQWLDPTDHYWRTLSPRIVR